MPPKRLSIFEASELENTMVGSTEAPAAPPARIMDPEILLSKEEIREAMPGQLKMSVSDELVAHVNLISRDPQHAEAIRQNFISFTHVLKEGKFKITQYLSAAAYVTYKMMGFTNQDAYARTFPERMQRLRAENKDEKAISSYVSAYNKNKLVNLILEQTLIAPWILNQDLYQKALFVQADLMVNATSEKVQTEAANSILNALKRPETAKLHIDVDVKDSTGIGDLEKLLVQIAEKQQDQIDAGVPTKEIAHQEIFEKPAIEGA